MNPFPNDLRGLLAALGVASEILAGKFWPSHVVKGTALDAIQARQATHEITGRGSVPEVGDYYTSKGARL